MTDGIRPVGGPEGPSVQERRDGDRRGRERRQSDAKAKQGSNRRDVVSAGPVVELPPSAIPAAPMPVPPAAFAAQVIGQYGQKRGLKGGPPVLEAARSSYLGTEYSGKNDRRPTPGQDTETEI